MTVLPHKMIYDLGFIDCGFLAINNSETDTLTNWATLVNSGMPLFCTTKSFSCTPRHFLVSRRARGRHGCSIGPDDRHGGDDGDPEADGRLRFGVVI